MANDTFFKSTNSFRLSKQEQEEFNSLFTSLHPQHRPRAMKELFVNMFRTFVNSEAEKTVSPAQNEVNQAVNTSEAKPVYVPVDKPVLPAFKKVNEELNRLYTELHGQRVAVDPDDVLQAMCDYCMHEEHGKEFPMEGQIKNVYNPAIVV
jgi:hypothetical protein